MLERLFAGTGALAAVLASTCCVVPLGLGAAGLSSAWLSSLSWLAPYQTAFQVASIALLGGGFWTVYGRGLRRGNRLAKALLWTGAAVLMLVLTSPWWHGLLT
jgi:mercuric ion transport protein